MKPRVGGFAGTPGSGGTYDDPAGYISPLHQEVIDSNIEHTYTYQLILGTLTEIRSHVSAQQYRPGLITQLRFDPAFNGEPGDYVDVKAISSNPFAGNEHIAPTLNIARTNGDTTSLRHPTASREPSGESAIAMIGL